MLRFDDKGVNPYAEVDTKHSPCGHENAGIAGHD